MYKDVRSRVYVNGQYSEEFGVRVGVYQGSFLSPLLFILVLEALSRQFHTDMPWELLYTDDLVVMAHSLEEYIAKLKACKEGMKRNGLKFNLKKIKLMVTGPKLDIFRDSGAFSCAVCWSCFGVHSIECSNCKQWIYKECSGVRERLVEDPYYVCPRCCDRARPIDNRPVIPVDVNGSKRKAMNRNWCNQKANPALNTKAGNK